MRINIKYIVIVYICVCRVVVETVLNRIVSKKPNAFLLSFHRYWCCVLVDAIILVFVNSFFSLLVLSTLSYCLRPTQTFFHYDDHSPLGFFSFYFLFLFIFQSIIHSSMNKLADVDFITVTTSTLKWGEKIQKHTHIQYKWITWWKTLNSVKLIVWLHICKRSDGLLLQHVVHRFFFHACLFAAISFAVTCENIYV